MLSSVFSKTILDRYRAVLITVISLAVLLVFAMAVYQDIDLSLYNDLPEGFQSLLGIPADADVAVLAFTAIYNSYGALALGGVAIAMGATLIAGEERKGTIGVLLGNPISRTHVLASTTAALLTLILTAGLLLWGAGATAPMLLDVSLGGMHIGAFTLHMTLGVLFYGLLALAIGGWTGKSGLAGGTAAGLMVVSFFAVGLLPLVDSLAGLAKVFPWYYIDGSDPLSNGVDWAHIAVLVALGAAMVVVALVGVNRRDLRSRSVGASLLDQLRTHPLTAKAADRLAGRTRVSHIWVKTASDHQGLLFVVCMLMFWVMGVMLGPIYNAISADVTELGEALPEGLMALFGGGDMSTPEGYYQLETFGMIGPIAVMVATIAVGARALAGEEENRTMGLLLANPIPRRRVVMEKAATMVLFGAVVGVVIAAGVIAGSWLGGLGISPVNIAATSLLCTLVSLVFGTLSLLLSAATGKTRVAIWIPVGAALVLHVLNAMAELGDAAWGVWSPFHYYLTSDPLVNGMNWGDGAILLALILALGAAAPPAFQRRDLRQ